MLQILSGNITLFPKNIGLIHKGKIPSKGSEWTLNSITWAIYFSANWSHYLLKWNFSVFLCDFAVIKGLRFKFSVLFLLV